MFKYIAAVFVTIIGFLAMFAILMIPFMSGADGGIWMLCCALALSIQISIIAVYFNDKIK
ncbi:hypothetical protein [Thomasclavelia sp.]